MAIRKLRQGDEVIVTCGKDRGKRGTLVEVHGDNRVIVEGVNLAKKHTRPNPQRGLAGGIIEKEVPIHISNVAVYNSATNKADRVGIKVLEDGRKVRYFKSTGEVVDV